MGAECWEALLQPSFLTQLQQRLGELWQRLQFEGLVAGPITMQQYLQHGQLQRPGASPVP